ncbi:MAG: acyl-CoA dehydrogenase family protein [Myxococcota bacterium]
MEAIVRHVLTVSLDGAEVPGVAAWWARHADRARGFAAPVERAMAAAVAMDRLGWAFASGYQEALRRLVPDLPDGCKVALCATEEGGNHPRAIETRLEPLPGGGLRLSGHKKLTTLGTHADRLLVVASEGPAADGRNRLRVVSVPRDREGVSVEPMPHLPFVPEVPHAETRLAGVRVRPEEVLPGDGYADYLKPFRTIEDVHVHAALLAWLVGVGRRADWPADALQGLMAPFAAAWALAAAPPLDEAVHVALGGLLDATARALEALAPLWARVDEPTRTRWERDRVLLGVASKARNKRLEAAWSRLHRAAHRPVC